MGRDSIRRGAVGLATALAMLVGPLAPAAAVEAQGLRVEVVEESLLGAGSVLRPGVLPGGSVTYQLLLRNQREQDVEVLVYGADADPATGEVSDGTDNRGVGGWITAPSARIGLPADEATTVGVTVTRPDGDEEGGLGAIVVQLSDASRQDLQLDRIQRVAQLVEVAADGSGDGVQVEILGTDVRGGLVPDVLAVEVRYAAPSALEQVSFDGSVVLARRAGSATSATTPVASVDGGDAAEVTVEVDVPWYGLVGRTRATAAMPGLTSRSAAVRVVVLPPWLGLVMVVGTGAAVVAIRRRRDDGTTVTEDGADADAGQAAPLVE